MIRSTERVLSTGQLQVIERPRAARTIISTTTEKTYPDQAAAPILMPRKEGVIVSPVAVGGGWPSEVTATARVPSDIC